MKIHCGLLLSLLLPSASAAAVNSSALDGWGSCPGSYSDAKAECAIYSAPLCYDDVCEDESDQIIDVYVQRVLARSADSDTAPNVWLLNGGPAASIASMQRAMQTLFSQLSKSVNVYLMDRRGTGNSNLLTCDAVPHTIFRSELALSDVAECAYELETQYGSDLSSFSTTSAAMDVATFTSTFLNGSNTFVYGVGNGTTIVERLMHLAPAEVVGYVLDAVTTTSGSTVDQLYYASAFDQDYGQVAQAYLGLCAGDSSCSQYFQSKDLPNTLADLLSAFDEQPNSTCASLVRDHMTSTKGGPTMPASYTLRRIFADLLTNATMRTLIPALTYRMVQCNADDKSVISSFASKIDYRMITTFEAGDYDDPNQLSPILDPLVAFSEAWEEDPVASYATMLERFTKATMAGGVMANLAFYCAFTQSNSSACTGLDGIPSLSASPIVYAKDKYWNKAATIPSQASVLLMSGKLDPLAPYKYATSLLEALDGTNKELITFDSAAGYGTIWSTPMNSGPTCGMTILASYVTSEGDLASIDKSCVDQVNTLELLPSSSLASDFLDTDDAFDGKSISGFDYDYEIDTSIDPWMVAGMLLTAIFFAVLMWWFYRRRKRQLVRAEYDIVTAALERRELTNQEIDRMAWFRRL